MLSVCLLLLPALAAAALPRVARSCGPCDPSSCAPLPPAGCAFPVPDACGCCELCTAGAGEQCGLRGSAAPRCAPGFECVRATRGHEEQRNPQKKKNKKPELGVCACKKDDYAVCGSDGVEYRSVCELKAANAFAERRHKPAVTVNNKGKCAKARLKAYRRKSQCWRTGYATRYHFKKNLRRIVSELYVRDNCHPFKATLLVWVQLPMWVSISLALRNVSAGLEHVQTGLQQELAAGGALWFPDLTVPDSTWIIPVSLGLINLLITEVYALSKLEQSTFRKYVTNFIRGISLVMIPLAATVPSSMALYWLSSSCIGLAHNLLLRSPRFRSLCRIPPSRSDSHTPYRDIAAAFVTKYIK